MQRRQKPIGRAQHCEKLRRKMGFGTLVEECLPVRMPTSRNRINWWPSTRPRSGLPVVSPTYQCGSPSRPGERFQLSEPEPLAPSASDSTGRDRTASAARFPSAGPGSLPSAPAIFCCLPTLRSKTQRRKTS